MDTNTYMPVMPAGNGDFGGNGAWWLILLFLFMGFGGGLAEDSTTMRQDSQARIFSADSTRTA